LEAVAASASRSVAENNSLCQITPASSGDFTLDGLAFRQNVIAPFFRRFTEALSLFIVGASDYARALSHLNRITTACSDNPRDRVDSIRVEFAPGVPRTNELRDATGGVVYQDVLSWLSLISS